MVEGHPDRGRLLAYRDGELREENRKALRRHLEECTRCRRRLEEIESREALFSDAAGRLDRPMPEIPNPGSAGNASGLSSGGGSVVAGGSGNHGTRFAGFPPLRAAAVVLLFLIGGALLTPAGRALAEHALSGIAGLFRTGPASPAATVRQDTAARRGQATAVSASPSDGRLQVVIQTADSAAGVLRLGPRAGGRVRVEGMLRDVERGPGRLRVRVDGLDGIRIRLPDSVGAAEVLVDGRRVVTQSGRSVTPVVAEDTVDGEILLRVRP